MNIYLLRDKTTGHWLGQNGWEPEPTSAFIYTGAAAQLDPKPGLEWVQFCEVPL